MPSVEEGRTLIPHPATRADDKGAEDGAETQWIAMLPAKEAGVGRQLARDLYANGQWNVLSRLTAIVPHGASIGLDSKSFSFFFPRGQMYGAPQGFMRFVSGTRVQEYGDRKVNPRLLLESECEQPLRLSVLPRRSSLIVLAHSPLASLPSRSTLPRSRRRQLASLGRLDSSFHSRPHFAARRSPLPTSLD